MLLAKTKTMAVLQSALWLRPHGQVGAEAGLFWVSGASCSRPCRGSFGGGKGGPEHWLRGRSKVDIATRSKSSHKTPTANFPG